MTLGTHEVELVSGRQLETFFRNWPLDWHHADANTDGILDAEGEPIVEPDATYALSSLGNATYQEEDGFLEVGAQTPIAEIYGLLDKEVTGAEVLYCISDELSKHEGKEIAGSTLTGEVKCRDRLGKIEIDPEAGYRLGSLGDLWILSIENQRRDLTSIPVWKLYARHLRKTAPEMTR